MTKQLLVYIHPLTWGRMTWIQQWKMQRMAKQLGAKMSPNHLAPMNTLLMINTETGARGVEPIPGWADE